MTTSGAADGLPGIAGDYHGRPTRRIENAHSWLEVLAHGGPRIVGFGLTGAESVLAQAPDVKWDAGHGVFELLGGHRLWWAPESSDCSVPDSTGVELTAIGGGDSPGVRMTGAVEAPTGLRKIVEARLDPASAAVSLRHVFKNEGARTIELSPWPITQLRLGGTATVELPPRRNEHAMGPNQVVVLWPYGSWSDDRLSIVEGLLSVEATPGPAIKVGCLSHAGVASYLHDGLLFVKRFDAAADKPHADMGCNVEIYTDQSGIELESLGPLVDLGPGESVTHDERWELSRAE